MQKIFLRSITVVQSKSFLNMSSITKISIDKAVYEYSGLIWGDLVGESPEKCVGILSAGKGITPKNISDVKSKIQELKKRTPFFVPRVRMEKDYGYGSANAKWLRSLKTRENSLKMSVVYLADAVNDIIRKPYTDQIARLRETVDEESRLKKDGQQLTAEQTAKLEGVEKQVSEIREQMKKLPKCTNAILTTLLHEVVDDMSEEDGSALEEITREISEQSALIEQYTKAKAEEEAKEKVEVADGQESNFIFRNIFLEQGTYSTCSLVERIMYGSFSRNRISLMICCWRNNADFKRIHIATRNHFISTGRINNAINVFNYRSTEARNFCVCVYILEKARLIF